MTIDLFAGLPVHDYTAAAAWYERFLGAPPSFLPNDTEAVWELAYHRTFAGLQAGSLCSYPPRPGAWPV
jgi:hypothetical protein